MSGVGARLAAKWHGFAALSPLERQWFVSAVLRLPLVWCGLRWWGYRRVQQWVSKKRTHAPSGVSRLEHEALCRLGQVVNLGARQMPFHASCLVRSLVLQWLFRRHGMDSVLCIGVKRIDGVFAAHAWVSCAGRPVNDSAEKVGEYLPITDAQPMQAAAFD
jgi:hypothetical protein